MPGGMSGAELCAEVEETYPHIKRLITSGYAEVGAASSDGTVWLRKPYTLNEMSMVFRQVAKRDGRS